MNARERLSRCYRHQETDRPGIYVRTGYPINDPTYEPLKQYLATHSDLKAIWDGRKIQYNLPVTTVDEAYNEDFVSRVFVLNTPGGSLRSVLRASRHGLPGMVVEHYIKDETDIDRYLTLSEPALHKDVSDFFALDAAMSERGISDVFLGNNPAGKVVELMGSETFALMSITSRSRLHELVQQEMRVMLRLVQQLLELGVGPFFSMMGQEYLVPPLHGLKDFYDFNVHYDKPIIDMIHEADGFVHIHCHGQVRQVIQGFLDMGADVVHPFEAPPFGDLTPCEAKKILRGRICYEGSIQISDLYEKKPENIREQTEQLIQEVYDKKQGLIVCPAASPYIRGQGAACYEQFKALTETVIRWR